MEDEGAADGNDEEENFNKLYPNINEEFREEVDECFEIFDKDKDNFINYYDLTNLLRWLKFNPTEREMKRYIEEHDPAKNQLISRKSVYKIANQKILEPDTLEELVEAMKILDTNRDGTIYINELRYAMTKHGDPLDEAQVDEMVTMITGGEKGKENVEILEFASTCFGIQEKKKKKD